MKDVQSGPADVAMAIDRVGVKGLKVPLSVRDRAHGRQQTVAAVDLAVDLPAEFKGTHMSRFVEILGQWRGDLDYASCKELLTELCARLQAGSAHARFLFPYFVTRAAPVSGIAGPMHYDCELDGELKAGRMTFTLRVEVPVMTVCPCSKAISDEGAHSQRAVVRIACRAKGFVWIEELVDIAESSASSPVYSLLKREDEKRVTENSFANPCFVEDVVRAAAKRLSEDERVTWFSVDVESQESIHNHAAYASIELSRP
ncbi:GTP cyclohydrolase FolE2 [Desulfovibrio sp. X2]|uniref:GTP cyclohydrolase FolE2 n=1 Tax=Desulfovibrio sp. X2 TaxID=941449 RepID=UPI000A01EECA|nr:GTP cyclohydrolase FolE2 [Desulfovibrio sp. X2]